MPEPSTAIVFQGRVQKRPSEQGRGKARSGLTAELFERICETYAQTGATYGSCEYHGVSYGTVTTAIQDQRARGDESWAELWAEAYQKFRESLEVEVFRRGRDGTPIKWKLDEAGNRIAVEWQYSDRLLELATKGHFPERYRDTIHHSGQIGLEPVDAFANLSTKAKREIRAIIMRDLEEQREMAKAREDGATVEATASGADDATA